MPTEKANGSSAGRVGSCSNINHRGSGPQTSTVISGPVSALEPKVTIVEHCGLVGFRKSCPIEWLPKGEPYTVSRMRLQVAGQTLRIWPDSCTLPRKYEGLR